MKQQTLLSIIIIILITIDIILNIIILSQKGKESFTTITHKNVQPPLPSPSSFNLMIPNINPTTVKVIDSLKALFESTKDSKLSIKILLEKSIHLAYKNVNKNRIETIQIEGKKSNIQANPIANLNDYFNFLSDYSGFVPGFNFRNPSKITRQEILNGICIFNFIPDQPLSELDQLAKSHGKKHGIFQNHLQYYPPFAKWMTEFVDSWGVYLDDLNSWNDEIYQDMYDATCTPSCIKGFDDSNKQGLVQGGAFTMRPVRDKNDKLLKQGWYGQGNLWRSWNDWFSRILVCPNQSHPIEAPNDSRIVTSPADSVPQGIWDIHDNSDIKVDGGIQVKLIKYFNVNDLLREDSNYIDYFKGGKLTHTFLNVYDYHRYHYPVTGTVVETAKIRQNVSLQVSWNEKKQIYEPDDGTGWQFAQTRSYVIVHVEGTNYKVALIPMGMAQVSSVNITYPTLPHNMPKDTHGIHKKGDELGNFLFGASDFLMVFPKIANFNIIAPKTKDGSYQHILVGEKYGTIQIPQPHHLTPQPNHLTPSSMDGWKNQNDAMECITKGDCKEMNCRKGDGYCFCKQNCPDMTTFYDCSYKNSVEPECPP